MVPHLTTALIGPLLELEKHIIKSQPDIEHWFRSQWQSHKVPFYASVDLRNSGFKLAPVDTNLFPGGFNNLNPDFLPLLVLAAQSAIEKICPDAHGALLIPENHTRNLFYLENVSKIVTLLRTAGVNVRVGTLNPEITQPTTLDLPNGGQLVLEPLIRKDNRLHLANFNPCVILLNNDLSGGVPDILKNLDQEVIPPLLAGWTTRRKSAHFAAYDHVATDFADLIDIDPWLVNPYFGLCNKVNFMQREGEDCLATEVDRVLKKIQLKYDEYGVKDKPFVIVKADAGTYGMGIMTIKDASEVRDLNRKQRNKMSVIKEGLNVSDALIQEGVYTFESINDAVAEPVVYMVDHFVVGGFYRVHTGRGVDENLNAPGMHFVPLAFDTSCTLPNPDSAPNDKPNRFYSYGVIARMALLAASIELEEMHK
ncbi:MAG: glutamate--cysteine ligase [Gallionellaceae bacterium]|jgi:glutamate--cysteine ligase